MSNLRETCKWIGKHDGKTLTPPPGGSRFIGITFVDKKCDDDVDKVIVEHTQSETTLPFARTECFVANFIDVKQLINNDGNESIKNVYELTLQIKNKCVNYLPGDTIGILPQNSDEAVNQIIEKSVGDLKSKHSDAIRLIITPEALNQKRVPKMPVHLPARQTTIYKLLQESVDMHAFPKKAFLWALINYNLLRDETERRFIEILCSREGSSLYTTEILQCQMTFFDLLNRLKSWSFSFENIGVLFEHLPRLMPRPYSISNSLSSTETMDDYCRKSTILKIIFSINNPPGLTTRMLQQLIFKYQVEHTLKLGTNDQIANVYFRQSNRFQLTDDDLKRPLLMIAIGTGIAPFIGFLEHIQQMKKRSTSKCPQPNTWLIFGCRYPNKQLCKDQLNSYVKDGTLSKFNECFSRDSNTKWKYVQDCIRNEAINITNFLFNCDDESEQPSSKVYICGSKQMSIDVRAAIAESLIKADKCSAIEDAKQIIDEFVKNGRYIEDIWT